MKKCISIVLALFLCLHVSPSIAAYTFPEEDYINPFTGEPYYGSFSKSGIIDIYITHEKSIDLHQYTCEDFPLLEIEYIDIRHTSNDPDVILKEDYHAMGFIILKDKRDRAVVEAVDTLYRYYNDIIYEAIPDNCPYGVDLGEIMTGDVNFDDAVDLNDVSWILKYIAGWDESFPYNIGIYGDTDYNNTINLMDVSVVLKIIAGWDEIY